MMQDPHPVHVNAHSQSQGYAASQSQGYSSQSQYETQEEDVSQEVVEDEEEEIEEGMVNLPLTSADANIDLTGPLPTEAELKKMKLPVIRAMLKARKLPISGNKPVLITRLLTGEPAKKKGRKRKSDKKGEGSDGSQPPVPVGSLSPAPNKRAKKAAEAKGAGEATQDVGTIVESLREQSWAKLLLPEMQKDYFTDIIRFIDQEKASYRVFPPNQDVFNAFNYTPFDAVKVVIIGQDPYHQPGQAHGLAFSVQKGQKIPASLRNIYKELAQDVEGFVTPEHGNLEGWARQGVLLLNAVMTVREGQASSHANCGWNTFTDHVLRLLNEHKQGIVFLLWGVHAQKKGKLINKEKHHILEAPHPSPLAKGKVFAGCKHFSQTNQLLIDSGKAPIDWRVQ